MPFESKAQMRFMYAKHPRMAKEFAGKTPNMSELPEHKKDRRPVMPNMKKITGR